MIPSVYNKKAGHAHAHVHTHMHAHTHMHTHMHAHMHTCILEMEAGQRGKFWLDILWGCWNFQIRDCITHSPNKGNYRFFSLRLLKRSRNFPADVDAAGFLPRRLPPPACSPTLVPTAHSIRVPVREEAWCLVLIHVSPALAQPNVANEFIGYLDFLLCDLFRPQETGRQYNDSKFMSQNWEVRGPADKGN